MYLRVRVYLRECPRPDLMLAQKGGTVRTEEAEGPLVRFTLLMVSTPESNDSNRQARVAFMDVEDSQSQCINRSE